MIKSTFKQALFLALFFLFIAYIKPAAQAVPTETPSSEATETLAARMDINTEIISDATIIDNREFDINLGGYIYRDENKLYVYREGLLGDADVISQVDNISLENPVQIDGRNTTIRIELNERGVENLPNAIHELFIQGYMNQFEVERAIAEEMYANDELLEFSWMNSYRDWAVYDYSVAAPWTRYIRPSAGVSIILFQEPYQHYQDRAGNYPFMAVRFYGENEDGSLRPANTYGFGVTRNGRLEIYKLGWTTGQGIEFTSDILFSLWDASRFMVNQQRARILDYAQFYDFGELTDAQQLIYEALGLPSAEEANPNINPEDYSIVSIINR